MSKKHTNQQQTTQPPASQQPPIAAVGFGGTPINSEPPADDTAEASTDDASAELASDAAVIPAAPAEGAAPPLRQSAAPLCPNCNVQCRAASSPRVGSAYFTYYRCPTDGCTFSLKVPRPLIAKRLQADRDAEGYGAR